MGPGDSSRGPWTVRDCSSARVAQAFSNLRAASLEHSRLATRIFTRVVGSSQPFMKGL